jgi:hypothetical protein
MKKQERIALFGKEKYDKMQRANKENMRMVRGYYARKGRILDPNRGGTE